MFFITTVVPLCESSLMEERGYYRT